MRSRKARARQQRGVELGGRQQLFQPRRSRSVVVQPQGVLHQRQRADQVGAQAHRTQKAIFQPHDLVCRVPGGRFAAAPERQRRLRRRMVGEMHLAAAEIGPHDGLLPGRKANGLHLGRETLAHAALQCHPVDDPFHLATLQSLRIHIADVTHQRRVNQAVERRLAPPRWGRALVLRQPPAGVKRHAEGAHRLAPQQPFKTQLRSDRVNRRRRLQQTGRMHRLRHQSHARGLARGQAGEMAALAAAGHFRVHLEQDRQAGMLVQRRLQHVGEIAGIGQSAGDRRVSGGLVRHQHVVAATGLRGQFPGVVVLAHPPRAPSRRQCASTFRLGGRAAFSDHRLQAGRVVGVVINTQVIDHQRQGRAVGPRANGANKAIFQQPARQAMPPRQPLRSQAAGALSPTDHRLRVRLWGCPGQQDPRGAAEQARQRAIAPDAEVPPGNSYCHRRSP